MLTLELFRAFTDKEIPLLDEHVEAKQRTELTALYAALKPYRKRDAEPDTPTLYKKIYSKKYTAEKDYELRNELRRLNEIFYDFMVNAEWQKQLATDKATYNLYLARAYSNRQLHSLFGTEIDGMISGARAQLAPDVSMHLLLLKTVWTLYYAPQTGDAYEKGLAIVEEARKEVFKRMRYSLRMNENLMAGILKTQNTNTGKTHTEATDARTQPLYNTAINAADDDALERFYILRKYTFQTKGALRIQIQKELLELARAEELQVPLVMNETLLVLTDLASECGYNARFAEAAEYYAQALQLTERMNKPVTAHLLLGYQVAHIYLGNYNAAIQLYMDYERIILKSPLNYNMALMRSYTYLFLAAPDKALEHLPANRPGPDLWHLLQRAVYMIAFYQRNEVTLAANECKNIQQLLLANRNEDYVEGFMWVNGLFRKFLKAKQQHKQKMMAELKLLGKELEAQPEKTTQVTNSGMPLLWLLKELEREKVYNKPVF